MIHPVFAGMFQNFSCVFVYMPGMNREDLVKNPVTSSFSFIPVSELVMTIYLVEFFLIIAMTSALISCKATNCTGLENHVSNKTTSNGIPAFWAHLTMWYTTSVPLVLASSRRFPLNVLRSYLSVRTSHELFVASTEKRLCKRNIHISV